MLFRLSEVYKSYGPQDVLRGASLQVNAGEHVGLVGRNGAGKSTIFRLVRGAETADRGDVVRARGVRLGLLDQHVHFKPGSTVHESALAAFGRLQQIEHEMHELEQRMAEAGDDAAYITAALGDIARARGMAQLAKDTGISREGLYKALSSDGNPSLATVLKVVKALGLKLTTKVA